MLIDLMRQEAEAMQAGNMQLHSTINYKINATIKAIRLMDESPHETITDEDNSQNEHAGRLEKDRSILAAKVNEAADRVVQLHNAKEELAKTLSHLVSDQSIPQESFKKALQDAQDNI